MATGILTGKKLPQKDLFTNAPKREADLNSFLVGVGYEKVLGQLEGYEKRLTNALQEAESLKMQLEKAITERDLARKESESLLSAQRETEREQIVSRETLAKLRARISEMEEASREKETQHEIVSQTQVGMNREIEEELVSVKARLTQTEKLLAEERSRKVPKAPIITPSTPPSYSATPVYDAAGNILSVTMTPIGGN